MPSAAPVRVFALHLALAGALVGTGCVDIVGAGIGRYVEREEKRFTVSGKPDVALATFDGSIEIRTWDKQDVQVTIEKRGKSKAAIDTIEIQAEQAGNQHHRRGAQVRPARHRRALRTTRGRRN